jgi:large subunit ribosomal protein L3
MFPSMIPALLGTKVGMTRILADGGRAEPVTVVKCGPCVVLQVKTKESDGYDAVQLGYDDVKPHRSTKPMIGHAAKVGSGPKRVVREVRLNEPTDVSAGDVLTVELFAASVKGLVDVTGVTKGKGFAGVMKRHGFGGMGASHGTERKHRSPGSIGANAPGATGRGIKKGKRMSGQLGNVRRTQRAVELLRIDPEHDLLLIRGSVPGPDGGAVFVRGSKKSKAKKG